MPCGPVGCGHNAACHCGPGNDSATAPEPVGIANNAGPADESPMMLYLVPWNANPENGKSGKNLPYTNPGAAILTHSPRANTTIKRAVIFKTSLKSSGAIVKNGQVQSSSRSRF